MLNHCWWDRAGALCATGVTGTFGCDKPGQGTAGHVWAPAQLAVALSSSILLETCPALPPELRGVLLGGVSAVPSVHMEFTPPPGVFAGGDSSFCSPTSAPSWPGAVQGWLSPLCSGG